MKYFLIFIFLSFKALNALCQVDALSLDNYNQLKIRLDSIDNYVKNIDGMYLSSSILSNSPDLREHSSYTEVAYDLYHRNNQKREMVKLIKSTRDLNTAYYKNDKLVYVKNIATVHGNYAEIMEEYYQGDSMFYSRSKIVEEHVLKITYNYIAPMHGGSNINFSVDKDSVKYSPYDIQKGEQNNLVTANWTQILGSVILMDFDDIGSGTCLAYIDESCYSYTITTDLRTHVISDMIDPIKLQKIKEFLALIRQYQPAK